MVGTVDGSEDHMSFDIREFIGKMHYVADLLSAAEEVTNMPNCNDCGCANCTYKPEWGKPVRFNCPLWKPMEGTKDE